MTTTFDLEHTVRLAQGGDASAFEQLVLRYKNVVFAVALGVLRDADAASDVTQGVFVAAWQRLRELRRPSALCPWLRETARRQALHHLRGAMRQRARVMAAPEAAANADTLLEEREDSLALEVALDQVPADAREVLLLFYSEDQSVAQVASLLEISSDAVKKRLQRGRVSLREEYERTLQRKLKRVLPGAALVAAILSALEGTSQAAPRKVAPFVAAACGALVVAGLVVAQSHAAPAPAQHPVASATSPASTIPALTSGAASSTSPKGSMPAAGGAQSSLLTEPPPPAECMPRSDVKMRALLEVHRSKEPLPPLPPSEVAARLDAAFTRWVRDLHTRAKTAPNDTQTPMPAEWRANVTWLIEHCGTSKLFTNEVMLAPYPRLTGLEPELAALWRNQIARHPGSARVYANAARFFDAIGRSDESIALLERAQALDPDNVEWTTELASAHGFESQLGDCATAADHGQNALGYIEEALAKPMSADAKLTMLERGIDTALSIREDGAAGQSAADLLALAPQLGADAADAIHWAHIGLGRVALDTQRVPEAERQLGLAAEVGSSRVLSSFGPDFVLAEKLLVLGRRAAVLSYVERVQSIWTDGSTCTTEWTKTLRAGGTPILDKQECHVGFDVDEE